MTIPEDKLTIVWVGRFLRSGGYGAATRGIYRALQEGPFHLVGIDIDTRRPIDDRLFRISPSLSRAAHRSACGRTIRNGA